MRRIGLGLLLLIALSFASCESEQTDSGEAVNQEKEQLMDSISQQLDEVERNIEDKTTELDRAAGELEE